MSVFKTVFSDFENPNPFRNRLRNRREIEDISELTFPTSSHSKHSKPRKCDQTMFERRLNCAEAAERQTVTPYLSLCSAPALAASTPPLARPYRSPLPTPTHHRPHAPSRRDHGPATSAPSVSRHLHPRTPPRTTSMPLGLTTHTPGCAHALRRTLADCCTSRWPLLHSSRTPADAGGLLHQPPVTVAPIIHSGGHWRTLAHLSFTDTPAETDRLVSLPHKYK
jgi:hypothetical protein